MSIFRTRKSRFTTASKNLKNPLHLEDINLDELPIKLPPKSPLGRIYKRKLKGHTATLVAAIALAFIAPITAQVIKTFSADNRSKAASNTSQPLIKHLVIVDAETNQDFMVVNQPQVFLQRNELPKHFNIRAEVSGFTNSLLFYVDDKLYRTENAAPYAIAGDNEGNFNPWTLPGESFEIAVIASSLPNGKGETSPAFSTSFSIEGLEENELIQLQESIFMPAGESASKLEMPILLGDCNGDRQVDETDRQAITQEISDGDGLNAKDAAEGSFRGRIDCDANADEIVSQADVACLENLLIGQACQLPE